jgi:cyclic pyranopterin phosphate synthase
MKNKLSHLDEQGNPNMVDVGNKKETERTASASCVVTFPPEVASELAGAGMRTRKGSIVQTAVLAGIMGAKKTSELIPLCHPLPLNDCKINMTFEGKAQLVIRSIVKTTGKTGVEMEALTAVSVAALTVYDMVKGLSHDIRLGPIQLESKSGGKRDYDRQ